MCFIKTFISRISAMLVVIVTLVLACQVSGLPAPCTEDSQCSSGFFCEQSALVCRECLHCDQLGREPPAPDFCVYSAVQCGPCLKGQDPVGSGCLPPGDEGAPHALLPTYAWAAVAGALLLMLLTLCVFLKMKTFKVINYSSRTSVQSLRAVDSAVAAQPLAPPPYNCIPPTFSPVLAHADAPEIQCLVDSPQPRKAPIPEGPSERGREAAGSQAASVYSHPAYVRLPQTLNSFRGNAAEEMISPANGEEHRNTVPPSFAVARASVGTDDFKLENAFNQNNVPDREPSYQAVARANSKDEDSNNNRAPPSEASGASYPGAYIIGGPSFVINVVENVAAAHPRADAFHHPEST